MSTSRRFISVRSVPGVGEAGELHAYTMLIEEQLAKTAASRTGGVPNRRRPEPAAS
jgi:hypothetical protein